MFKRIFSAAKSELLKPFSRWEHVMVNVLIIAALVGLEITKNALEKLA